MKGYDSEGSMKDLGAGELTLDCGELAHQAKELRVHSNREPVKVSGREEAGFNFRKSHLMVINCIYYGKVKRQSITQQKASGLDN